MTTAHATSYSGHYYEPVDPMFMYRDPHRNTKQGSPYNIDKEYDWDDSYFAFALKKRG